MWAVLLALILASVVWPASNILNSPHNLSVSGVGTIKATTEKEVCVFCHIPHHEKIGVPLWNHALSSANYILYSSEFISRTGYPAPKQLALVEGQPGIVSRLCLSCHDGTVAIGAVYWVRGTNLFDVGQVISMTGVNPDGTMPATATGYIGTDLKKHHPVAIEYNPAFTFQIGGTTKTIELRNPSPTPPIKLYDYAGVKYVECTSCHDPHKYDPTVNNKFLRIDNGPTLAVNVLNTCISCHDRPGWPASAHATAINTYPDPAVSNKYGTNTVASLGCVNCHIPHKGQGVPYLLRWVEEQTCFKGASTASNLSACHGNNANNAKIIEAVLLRTYKHPVMTKTGVHTNLDFLYGTGNPPQPPGSKGITFSNNPGTDYRHAECPDCHNPHKAAKGNHATPASNVDPVNAGWYPLNPSNLVSNALLGVSGVEPLWTGAGTQPTNYNILAEATAEYQICFKCHSYWALGLAQQWVSAYTFSDGRTTPAGTPFPLTDVAAEFNPNNASGHPVVVSANSRPGSYAPKALPPQAMREPWKSFVGNVTMYCSDCHGADNEAGANPDPRGPHGSNIQFMLKGPGKYWPLDRQGNFFTPWGISMGLQNVNDLFCNNCHDIPWIMNNVRPHNIVKVMMQAPCVDCHVAVPHGSPVSRLIGYCYFPEPYNYKDINGRFRLRLAGFKKDFTLKKANAYSVYSNPNITNCKAHKNANIGYDCYPNSPFVNNCGDFNPPAQLPLWCYQ